jgi:hypothetical protein
MSKTWSPPYEEYVCKFRRLIIGVMLSEYKEPEAWSVADQCYAELKGWGFNGFIINVKPKVK